MVLRHYVFRVLFVATVDINSTQYCFSALNIAGQEEFGSEKL